MFLLNGGFSVSGIALSGPITTALDLAALEFSQKSCADIAQLDVM
jgi:hypothetical protein